MYKTCWLISKNPTRREKKTPQMSKNEVYVCIQTASQIKEQLFRTVINDPPFDLFFVEDLYTIRILADFGDECLFD